MTPASGRDHWGSRAAPSASGPRWVLSAAVGTRPAAIWRSTSAKSSGCALRLAISVASRLWNSGSEKRISCGTTERST